MKKILFGLLFIGIIITGGIAVHANTITEKIEVKPGINANSPFYFLDRGIENIRLWLTTNDEKEAKLLLQFAEERISELNELDEDNVGKYADDLIDDYSDNINKANERINQLILEDKLPEKAKLQLQSRLSHTVDVEESLNEDARGKVSDEVRSKMMEIKNRTYLTTIASGLTQEEIQALRDEGYGFGEILKLNTLANLTGNAIDDLKELDIFNEENEIDFSKVATLLNITEEELMSEIKTYRDTVKEEIQARIQNRLEERKEEIKERRDQIRDRVNPASNRRP